MLLCSFFFSRPGSVREAKGIPRPDQIKETEASRDRLIWILHESGKILGRETLNGARNLLGECAKTTIRSCRKGIPWTSDSRARKKEPVLVKYRSAGQVMDFSISFG